MVAVSVFAEPFSPNSLFNRENTGNFFNFALRICSIFGGNYPNSMTFKNFVQKWNRE